MDDDHKILNYRVFEKVTHLPLPTVERLRDRSIISSIKPKFENSLFVDLRVWCFLWTKNCSANSANQNKIDFMFRSRTYKIRKSSKNRLSNFGIIEETINRPRILLAIRMPSF